MERAPRPGKTACLSHPFHLQLDMYAVAAGAAGVCFLVATPGAEGKIIYTPRHIVISPYNLHLYDIDLNHDGKTDFVLQTKFFGTSQGSAGTQQLLASGVNGNGLARRAAPLKAGKVIGPNYSFQNRGVMASAFASAGGRTSVRGSWVNVSNHYLGLKFSINGRVHYGWARVSVQLVKNPFYLEATLTGYAYETVPGKAIIAGATKGPDGSEPAASAGANTRPQVTLGMLALGAPALSIWKRED